MYQAGWYRRSLIGFKALVPAAIRIAGARAFSFTYILIEAPEKGEVFL